MQRLRIPPALLALLCVFALLAGVAPCPQGKCSMPMPQVAVTNSMAGMACCASTDAVNAPRLCCSSHAQPAELQSVTSVQQPTPQTFTVTTTPPLLRMHLEQPAHSPVARPPSLKLPLRI